MSVNGGSYLMVKKFVNSHGQALEVLYGDGANPSRVTQFKDADNRLTTVHYNTYGSYSLPRIEKIVTPDGRQAEMFYDTSTMFPRLNRIRDAEGIESSIVYDGSGFPTSLTTPYGTTTIVYAFPNGYTDPFDRWIQITDPTGGKQAYALMELAHPGMPNGWPSDQMPANVPHPNTGVVNGSYPYGTINVGWIGTGTPPPFSHVVRPAQNSYHWGPGVLPGILAAKPDPWTWGATEFRKARIQNWLSDSYQGHVLKILNAEQAPTDGSTEGLITWYDYEYKAVNGGVTQTQMPGTKVKPATIAFRPPGDVTHWTWNNRNPKENPLERRSTYTDPATGLVAVRTVAKYTYGTGDVDPTEERDAANNLRWARTYGGLHQVLTEKRYFGTGVNHYYQSTYTYSGTRMTSRLQGGLTTTWTYTPLGGGTFGETIVESDSPVTRTETTVLENGRRTSHTDARGLVRTFTYNNLNQPLTTTWVGTPNTTETISYIRVSDGQKILDPVSVTDRGGNTTATTYDGLRRPLTVTDPRGKVTTLAYCACGKLESVTDPLNNQVTYGYDAEGRRISTIWTAAGTQEASSTTSYTPVGLVASQIDASGTTIFQYNHQGLATGGWLGSKRLFGRVYDLNDRMTSATDQSAVTTTLTYDQMNRVLLRTPSGGSSEETQYNVYGVWKQIRPGGATTTYGYNTSGRRTSEQTPNSENLAYTYNAAGDLLTLTDGRSKVTTWTYDTEGRMKTKRYHGQSFDQIWYDYWPTGKLKERRFYNDGTSYRWTQYTYDAAGNLTLVNYQTNPDTTLTYDDASRLISQTDAGLGTTAYTYKSWGAMATEDGPWSGTDDKITWAYDQAKRRTGLTLTHPGGSWVETYGFDAQGRWASVLSPASATQFAYSFKAISVAGDAYATTLIEQISQPGGNRITQSCDSLGRLTLTEQRSPGSPGTVINSHSYQYNTRHERTKQTLTDSSYVDYAYDAVGQMDTGLTKYSGGGSVSGEQFDYGYDAGWNMTTRTTGTGTTTYGVSDRNQVTSGDGTYSYDASGNRTGDGSQMYEFDDVNRVIRVRYEPPSNYANWRKVEFTYDGRSRLRVRVDFAYNSGSSSWYLTSETRYLYDGMLLFQERNSGNKPTVTYTLGRDLSGARDQAGGIGGLLARSVHSTATGCPVSSSRLYYADANGSITALTSAGASVTSATYRYDPFGRLLGTTGGSTATDNVMRFSSKPWHALTIAGTTGLYYYGHRFYDVTVQKWLNRDSIGELGHDGPNLYAFVRNAPPNLVDTDGQESFGIYLDPNGNWAYPHGLPKPPNPYAGRKKCGTVVTRAIGPNSGFIGQIGNACSRCVSPPEFIIAGDGSDRRFDFKGEANQEGHWTASYSDIWIPENQSCKAFNDCLEREFNKIFGDTSNPYDFTKNCQTAVRTALKRCGGFAGLRPSLGPVTGFPK